MIQSKSKTFILPISQNMYIKVTKQKRSSKQQGKQKVYFSNTINVLNEIRMLCDIYLINETKYKTVV